MFLHLESLFGAFFGYHSDVLGVSGAAWGEHAAALFNMEVGGHIYSRLTNPTVAVLEQRLAALDGGVAAIATASGMSALFVTVLALCSAGDHIVSSSQMYGANINLFELTENVSHKKTTPCVVFLCLFNTLSALANFPFQNIRIHDQ